MDAHSPAFGKPLPEVALLSSQGTNPGPQDSREGRAGTPASDQGVRLESHSRLMQGTPALHVARPPGGHGVGGCAWGTKDLSHLHRKMHTSPWTHVTKYCATSLRACVHTSRLIHTPTFKLAQIYMYPSGHVHIRVVQPHTCPMHSNLHMHVTHTVIQRPT